MTNYSEEYKTILDASAGRPQFLPESWELLQEKFAKLERDQAEITAIKTRLSEKEALLDRQTLSISSLSSQTKTGIEKLIGNIDSVQGVQARLLSEFDGDNCESMRAYLDDLLGTFTLSLRDVQERLTDLGATLTTTITSVASAEQASAIRDDLNTVTGYLEEHKGKATETGNAIGQVMRSLEENKAKTIEMGDTVVRFLEEGKVQATETDNAVGEVLRHLEDNRRASGAASKGMTDRLDSQLTIIQAVQGMTAEFSQQLEQHGVTQTDVIQVLETWDVRGMVQEALVSSAQACSDAMYAQMNMERYVESASILGQRALRLVRDEESLVLKQNADLAQLRAKAEEYRRSGHESAITLTRRDQELTQVRASADTLRTELATSVASCAQVTQERNSLTQDVTRLQSRLERHEERHKELVASESLLRDQMRNMDRLNGRLTAEKEAAQAQIVLLRSELADQGRLAADSISQLRSELDTHRTDETRQLIIDLRDEVRQGREESSEDEPEDYETRLSHGLEKLSKTMSDLIVVSDGEFNLRRVAAQLVWPLESGRQDKLQEFYKHGKTDAWFCSGEVLKHGRQAKNEVDPLTRECRHHKNGSCLFIQVTDRDGCRRLDFNEP